MHQSPRCGAKTRQGYSCRAPAVRGKARCRMHGGGHRSGAPPGNSNALKHGIFTASEIANREAIKKTVDEAAALIAKVAEALAD
ncbi:MAG: HGGxSTG domain-containing protein [Pseudomonadota bacterium]